MGYGMRRVRSRERFASCDAGHECEERMPRLAWLALLVVVGCGMEPSDTEVETGASTIARS
jgi:hypothetical protein